MERLNLPVVPRDGSGRSRSSSVQRSNRMIDRIAGAANEPTLVEVENVGEALVSLPQVKAQISNLEQNCKLLVDSLSILSELHPFIKPVILVFQTVWKLELTRRDNNRKVRLLYHKMYDMMNVFKIMKALASHTEADPDAANRLKNQLPGIILTMKDCSAHCDSYQKYHTAVKFLMSLTWQETFSGLADRFDAHKQELLSDLQIYISVAAVESKQMIATLTKEFKAVSVNMGLAFKKLLSRDEEDLAALVERNGGWEGIRANDTLLEKIVKKYKSGSTRIGPQMDDKSSVTLEDLQHALTRSAEDVVRENNIAFQNKYEGTMLMIQNSIKQEGDRIIKELNSGPHERIEDRDLRYIWKEMGWRGSVKARHLVLAIRDHFVDRAQRKAAAALSETVPPLGDQCVAVAEEGSDDWALSFIRVNRVQSLIEALDGDLSMFVTIAEVNAFTTQKPPSWSLPRWIAYWTAGIDLTIKWYYRAIVSDLDEVEKALRLIHPDNRRLVYHILGRADDEFCLVDNLLCGLYPCARDREVDWERDVLFNQYKDFIAKTERQMEKTLGDFDFFIDAENTFPLISGGGQPERYVLPIIHILLRRLTGVVQIGRSKRLRAEEVENVITSIGTISRVVEDRCRAVKGIFGIHELNKGQQMCKFFFGIFNVIDDHTGQYNSAFWLENSEDLPKLTDDSTKGKEFDIFSPRTTTLPIIDVTDLMENHLEAGHAATIPSSDSSIADNARAADNFDTNQVSNLLAASAAPTPSTSSDSVEDVNDQLVDHSDAKQASILSLTPAVPEPHITLGSEKADICDSDGEAYVADWSSSASWHDAQEFPSHDELSSIGSVPKTSAASPTSELPARTSTSGAPSEFATPSAPPARRLRIIGAQNSATHRISPNSALPRSDLSQESLSGLWRGKYSCGTVHSQLLSFSFNPQGSRSDFDGVGTDADSEFSISAGKIQHRRITFLTESRVCVDNRECLSRRLCTAEFDSEEQQLSGTWEQAPPDDGTAPGSRGVFVLKRPVHVDLELPSRRRVWAWYWFRRPPSVSYTTRWQRAIKAVVRNFGALYLTPEEYQEHYARRRRFIALLRACFTEDGLDMTQEAELAELSKSEGPRFWRSLPSFLARYKISHDYVSCDGCEQSGIQGSRWVCVQCSESACAPQMKMTDTLDLCRKCVTRSFSTPNGSPHTLNHNILQLRAGLRPRVFIRYLKQISSSQWIEGFDQGNMAKDDTSCTVCECAVSRPAWRCLDCTDYQNVFICSTCNDHTERQQPWLFDYTLPSEKTVKGYEHHWSHTLIFLPTFTASPPPAPSVAQRLDGLENILGKLVREHAIQHTQAHDRIHARFGEHMDGQARFNEELKTRVAESVETQTRSNEDINARISRIEALLARLVGSQASAS